MKMKEIRELSVNDLNGRIKDLSEEYFKLRFQHGIKPLENTARLKQLKKTIARMKTVIAQQRLTAE
ncbi:MAG: 50S ribosomal protein L29 [Deltaproteobacteria bacterium]|jgi:large subunit ribosomal protein L29